MIVATWFRAFVIARVTPIATATCAFGVIVIVGVVKSLFRGKFCNYQISRKIRSPPLKFCNFLKVCFI